MFKYATLLMVAGVVIIPVANHELDKSAADYSERRSQHYLVTDVSGAQCELLTLHDSASGKERVFPQAGCGRIDTSLAMVRAWRTNANGDVELDDERGRALIALQARSQTTYVNLNPSHLKLMIVKQ